MSAHAPAPGTRPQLISEEIGPAPGTFDVADMGRGLPGLPAEFTWRSRPYRLAALLDKWKASGPEVGRLHGQRYLRRHYFRVRTTDGQTMVIYCQRHIASRSRAKARWCLYTIEEPIQE